MRDSIIECVKDFIVGFGIILSLVVIGLVTLYLSITFPAIATFLVVGIILVVIIQTIGVLVRGL